MIKERPDAVFILADLFVSEKAIVTEAQATDAAEA
jgi:hypothetical protein